MGKRALLSVHSGPDAGQRYDVFGGQTTLGRSEQCQIVLADERASRQHATIRYEAGRWTIEDLSSANGTFVNGLQLQPHQAHPLQSGDWVRLANTMLEFQTGGVAYEQPENLEFSEPAEEQRRLHPLVVAMAVATGVLLLLLAALAVLAWT